MSRNSLPYSVECKSTYPFFERIAAFNCDQAAFAYASLCAAANLNFEYQVRKGCRILANAAACRPSYGAAQ